MRFPLKAVFLLYCATLLVALLVAMPLATLSAAGASATPAFELVDRNKDGFVDRAEAKAVPGLAERFDGVDLNGDGKLDRVEFARW